MHDLRIIAISTAAALVSLALAQKAERNGRPWLSRFALLLAIAVAGYVIYFGVTIVQRGQEHAFMSSPFIAELERSRELNPTTLLLLIARNWAYAVILIGVSLALAAGKQLLRPFWRSW
jgi:TRAP-type C4-dicarboxylate transport system permease small subunit